MLYVKLGFSTRIYWAIDVSAACVLAQSVVNAVLLERYVIAGIATKIHYTPLEITGYK